MLFLPERMIIIPPRYYCVIANPVVRDDTGKPVIDGLGQVKLRHADKEIRLEQEPIPLYPGEILDKVAK